MKILRFIFGFYLLLLSVQPCPELSGNLYFFETEQNDFFINAENSEPENQDCSPFCVCSCRQMSVLNLSDAFSEEKVFDFAESNPDAAFLNSYSHNHFSFIWQPPKSVFTI